MKASQYLNVNELVNLVELLISIQSHNNCEHYERDISVMIANYLNKNNVHAELFPVAEDRMNVIAKLPGKHHSKPLLFTGHMDTVDDYGYPELFHPYVRDNKIWGRGACDMKGPIACMMMAAVLIKRMGLQPENDVILAFVVDEEFKSMGTEALIKSGIKAHAAILGEPTGLNICLGNRGLEWIDIEVLGKGTHGGTAESGINAISKAANYINEMDKQLGPLLQKRNHSILGSSMMNIGMIQGGYQPSTVPDRCLIKIDRRWIPGESVSQIYQEYEMVINNIKRIDKEFKATLSRDESNMNEMEHGPVCIDPHHPIVEELSKNSKYILHKAPEIKSFPGWTDASLIGNFGKIPTVIFAPGDISYAHSQNEHIDVEELYNATLIYLETALTYGRKDDESDGYEQTL